MNRTTIVAASLLSCATAATAQSSVTLFGVVDVGVSYYSARSDFYNNTASPVIAQPGVTRSQTALSNSGTSNSRLGFRGTEDLGGGLAAGFWLESAMTPDNGAAAMAFNRRSTVGLSGPFGEIRLGRDFTPTFWNDSVFSPFSTIGVGANVVSTVGTNLQVARGPGSLAAASDNYLRTSNSIGYFLPPNLGGIYGQLQYALHENVSQSNLPGSPSGKGRYFGGRLGYAAGPLDVALAYGESTAADTTGVNAAGLRTGVNLDEKIKTLNLGASYDFGFVKIFGEVSQVADRALSTAPVPVLGLVTLRDSDKYKGGLLGITVPVGAGLIKAAYSRVKFDNDLGPQATSLTPRRDASVSKLAIGLDYNLSKRTALYATAARIRIKDGQNNPAIMGAVTGGVTYLSTGAGTSGFAPRSSTGYDFGIRHAF
ncbi:porin [Variovorax sp. J22G21]|uniref:porin n=1 Tax=Variovorax fucosicus TaxID=3053517 RepID=UPI00257813F5|nr:MULTISPECIES: porin [unclassified Variovorax]MDM0039803.1 porin [Variovorax sp. J22R193]MDM0064648.1 porin [Variovorax sp. J22G21]